MTSILAAKWSWQTFCVKGHTLFLNVLWQQDIELAWFSTVIPSCCQLIHKLYITRVSFKIINSNAVHGPLAVQVKEAIMGRSNSSMGRVQLMGWNTYHTISIQPTVSTHVLRSDARLLNWSYNSITYFILQYALIHRNKLTEKQKACLICCK